MSEKVMELSNGILKSILTDALVERPTKASFDEMTQSGVYSIGPENVKSGYPATIFEYGILIVAVAELFMAQIYIPHNWMAGQHLLAFRVAYNGNFNKWIVLPQSSVIIQS